MLFNIQGYVWHVKNHKISDMPNVSIPKFLTCHSYSQSSWLASRWESLWLDSSLSHAIVLTQIVMSHLNITNSLSRRRLTNSTSHRLTNSTSHRNITTATSPLATSQTPKSMSHLNTTHSITHLNITNSISHRNIITATIPLSKLRPQPPPKNGEIALLLATNRGYVVKCVSQKRNWSSDKSRWYNILITFIIQHESILD